MDDIGLTFCELLPPQFIDPEQDPNYVFRSIFEAFCEFDTEIVREEILNFSDIVNIEKTRIVDILLRNLGNPFPIASMTEDQKRRLARSLVAIYKRKGTALGIEQAILFFTSLTAQVIDFAEDASETFILGESELGVGTVLGPDLDGIDLFTFIVYFDIFLTDEQRAQVIQIVDFMKPGWTKYHIIEGDSLPFYEDFEDDSWL